MFARAVLFVVVAVLAGNFKHLVRLTEFPLPYPAENDVVEFLPAELLQVPHSPLAGRFAPTTDIAPIAQRLYGIACETVAPAPDGSITLIDGWNNVWQARPSPDAPLDTFPHALNGWKITRHPQIQHLGVGRTLGAMYDPEGNLVFADAIKGLCRVNFSATPVRLEVLATALPPAVAAAHQIPAQISYADDLDILPNGTIIFSDASTIPPITRNEDGSFDMMAGCFLEVSRGTPSGRLLAHDPTTGATSVLAKGIWFANGVALAPDASYVLVSETFALRVLRHWLAGPKAGTTEVFIDALPGYPDGVSRAADGGFWVTIMLPYLDIQSKFESRFVRWVMAWLPKSMKPKMKDWGVVVRVLESGEVVEVLADADAAVVSKSTSAVEAGGKLWFGNLHHDYVGVLDLAAARAAAASQ